MRKIGGKLENKDTKAFVKASYAKKKEVNSVNGFALDKTLSTTKNKVFVNPDGKVVVANAGTSNLTDWGNNVSIPFGLHTKTQRYKDAEKIQKKVNRKYGQENVTNVAHSQSGNIVNEMSKKGLINDATVVNPAIFGKHERNLNVIRSSGDVVSALTQLNKHDTEIKAKSYNPLTEHSVDIIGGSRYITRHPIGMLMYS